ncbi:hypothetical protein Cgig2_030647 [Carnegiea gigantea]|uniref:Uncharacterized protein n=1 Tax=Carnegiea gigantea TaxID=171969 RepID=A0A9Q1JK76_9CARY|nr:hypothetical protein Cgig2_030647 [Carnegiea gigantea]
MKFNLPKPEIPASPDFRWQGFRPVAQSRLHRTTNDDNNDKIITVVNYRAILLGIEEGIRPKEVQGHQSISTQCKSLSKQSNGNIITESLNHGDKRPNPIQPNSTVLNDGGVIPNAQPSKHIAFNHDGGHSHVELSTKVNPTSGGTLIKGCKPSLHSHAENQKRSFVGMNKQVKKTPLSHTQVDILVDTVIRNHPTEVHQYRSSEKKELIVFYLVGVAMGICKCKPELSMLDMALREKLAEITLVSDNQGKCAMRRDKKWRKCWPLIPLSHFRRYTWILVEKLLLIGYVFMSHS